MLAYIEEEKLKLTKKERKQTEQISNDFDLLSEFYFKSEIDFIIGLRRNKKGVLLYELDLVYNPYISKKSKKYNFFFDLSCFLNTVCTYEKLAEFINALKEEGKIRLTGLIADTMRRKCNLRDQEDKKEETEAKA